MALLEATHGLKENGGGGGEKDPHYLKICHACSTIMKLGTVIPFLKKIKKKILELLDTLIVCSAGISIFSSEVCKFCYIKKYRYRLYFDT